MARPGKKTRSLLSPLRDRLDFANNRDYFVATRLENAFADIAARGNVRLQALMQPYPSLRPFSFAPRFMGVQEKDGSVAYGVELVLLNQGRSLSDDSVLARAVCKNGVVTLWPDPYADYTAETAPIREWNQLPVITDLIARYGNTALNHALRTAVTIGGVFARGPQKSL